MVATFALYIAVCLVPIWVYYFMQMYPPMTQETLRIFDLVFLCRLVCSVLVHGCMHIQFGLRYRYFII